MNRTELRAAIEYVTAAAHDLHEEYRDESMTEDVQTRFDEGLAAVAAWTSELEALEERDRRAAALPRTPAASIGIQTETSESDLYDVRSLDLRGPRHVVRSRLRDRAMKVLEANEDSFAARAHLDSVEKHLRRNDPDGSLAATVISTTDPDYVRAFAQVVTGTNPALLSTEERVALERAVSVGTNNAGGFAVPTHLDPTMIWTNAGSVNPLRGLASVKTLPLGNTWNGVSHAGVTAAMNGEATEVTEGSPTYANPSIAMRKGEAYAVYSDEALQDIEGLTSDLMESFALAKDNLEATQMVTGAGTGNNTRGIVTALVADTTPVASATTDTFAVADVYALRQDVPARYRGAAGFSWICAQEIADLIRQFGSAVSHAFTVDLTADGPERVLGRPVYEADAMDGSITATADNYILIGGNIGAAFTIVDKLGMTAKHNPLVIDTTTNHPNGQEGIYVSWRFGCDLTNASAARILNVT